MARDGIFILSKWTANCAGPLFLLNDTRQVRRVPDELAELQAARSGLAVNLTAYLKIMGLEII